MKTIIIITALLVVGTAGAQTINWTSIQQDQRHVANGSVSWDYALTYGLGYGYKLNTRFPVILNAQFSIPSGENLVDDFKTKLGGQVRVYKSGNFVASIKVFSIFRRYQSDLVRMQNFGSEFTGIGGYYKPKWFVSGEFGFDKAIVTHIKNSDLMKENYPGVQDGWYLPTGGNFNFGIQGGYSIRSFDFNLRAGLVVDQSLNISSIIPYYFQLGVNKRF